MPLPSWPTNKFTRPFAAEGTVTIIPDTAGTVGRASQQSGFPYETQLPIASGGIAPSRPDFNGILYMLSAFTFWQQSGGQAIYDTTLNYQTPAIAFFDDQLWYCLQANGPETTAGVIAPGTNADYWQELIAWLNVGGGGNPVGTVITFYGTTAPEGYLACDGSAFSAVDYPLLFDILGVNTTPDMRGYFVRGYDTRATVDPSGGSRAVGSTQGDAMRNIVGSIDLDDLGAVIAGTGVMRATDELNARRANLAGTKPYSTSFEFNTSLDSTLPISTEIRPKNVNLLYCIKHD